MRNYVKQFVRNFDFPLFFTYLILCLFGLVMIYSSSLVWAVGYYDFEPDHFFRKQIINLAIAFPAFFVAAFFPYKNYKRKKLMIVSVIGMLLLLGLVHVFGYGREQLGAQSWINLAGINLQPSELAKIIILVYFASVFAKKDERGTIDSINQSIMPPIGILVIVIGSVMLETDMGTSLIIIVGAFSVIAASGINKNTFLKLSGIISVGLLLVSLLLYFKWDNIMTDSRKGRILSYLNPFDYIQGSGFQIANGYIAIGSGGVKGHGLGNSIQKMGYLPEPHTDVIMAIISEELGILGVAVVIGGLGFIVLRALIIALKAKDPHARMLAAGIGSMIGVQTFVNLGGLTGIIPLTGVPLPFISYGGTSVILMSIAVGILMNVSMFVKYENKKK
ncbi:FtsW/RodA/SpoVE family cell cycle protein [Sporosarcina pasteurii]|uniref:Probable peptidoglycan glycosyltransferase FtsW n=1 Tax=Sporosarcina pasteurii TaxID=1474 RepID=A0A380BGM2_SPOPA|nr:FtsW/RodA/SpoVE family cell cycle protein [Sporosarcina pasteurii]MDS9470456.1 FtsW/RodA/SpoVE family cell cycle protein [Sporosarcina pasteurii]QBQ05846.1 FtsW/RodA/SpoVE family cell cycle protein [Sporosarcina pasteurii]SUJ00270.1 Cell division protein FtsW [Sporosarcina pasteurii]